MPLARSSLTSNFREQYGEKKYRLLRKSDSVRSFNSSHHTCTPCSKTVVRTGNSNNNNNNILSCNIANRAVMTKSLKDANEIARQQRYGQDQEAGQSRQQSEGSDDSYGASSDEKSENDNDNDEHNDDDDENDEQECNNNNRLTGPKSTSSSGPEPIDRASTIVSSTSFRKIAKKRRKEMGRCSFHHTKSSKEYLRKAQEAYQRLEISEHEKQKQQQEIEGEQQQQRERSFAGSIDYGYEDPDVALPQQLQQPRRAEPVRRRNSVTKFSLNAANVVAAKAAAERILPLKPGLTSLPAIRNQQQQELRERKNDDGNGCEARPALSQRSRRYSRDVFSCGDAVVKRCAELKEMVQSQGKKPDDDSYLLQTTPSSRNCPLQLTSDHISSDFKPKSLLRKKTNTVLNMSLRFNTPNRTESWLSQDNSFGALKNNKDDDDDDDDDDDTNSLASDMESLCSIHDGSYRLDNAYNNYNPKNLDLPPLLPAHPTASPLILSSPLSTSTSTSKLTSLDHLTHFSGGKSSYSDHTPLCKSLVISWSNNSNSKGRSLTHLAADKISCGSERKIGNGKFPILASPGIGGSDVALITTKLSRTTSQSCMPAPVNRTPSNSWQ